MGRKNRKQEDIDWGEKTGDESNESVQGGISSNNEGSHSGPYNGNLRNKTFDKQKGRSGEEHGAPQQQNEVDFDPYLEVVEELKTQLVASHKALKRAHNFYTKQELAIQEAVQTKQQLEEMILENSDFRTTVQTLRKLEKRKEEEYASKLANVETAEQDLRTAKEKAVEDQKKLEEEKENLKKRVKAIEAEHNAKLQEEREKLDKEQEQQFRKRVEILERETKASQDEDKRSIAELEAENKKLSEKLEEQRSKVRHLESKGEETEKLKGVYKMEAEDARLELKRAENEFGLNTGPTEFYKDKFSKIYRDIQDISSRYFKELNVNDLDAVHDKIEEADSEFTTVPISTTEVSQNLRLAHAQRVISSQLREVIWQPFSSELTLPEPNHVSLLSKISNELAKSPHGGNTGLRAARVQAALTMRGLQFLSSALKIRAKVFTDKVMAVLSLLVKASLHSNLRNNLLDLATLAIALWDAAQTDEREFTVHPTLDPVTNNGWSDDTSATNGRVIVLLPRITARRYPRKLDQRPTGPPGMWIDSEQDQQVEEICIHDGAGLPEWSALVVDGEEEEDQRRAKQERQKFEEKERVLEEERKKLEKIPGHKRRISHTRRESSAGSGVSPSSPSVVWMKGGGQKIPEGGD